MRDLRITFEYPSSIICLLAVKNRLLLAAPGLGPTLGKDSIRDVENMAEKRHIPKDTRAANNIIKDGCDNKSSILAVIL